MIIASLSDDILGHSIVVVKMLISIKTPSRERDEGPFRCFCVFSKAKNMTW
jgi:hypothetical protein